MDDLISREVAIVLAYFRGRAATCDNPTPDGVDAVDVADLEKIPAVKSNRKQESGLMILGVYRVDARSAVVKITKKAIIVLNAEQK